ncbi:MAG TPA: SH3 domain-containing protein [Feifaniaceae bacterium]|nr:SH3 domain-containing protein [Feifaniaceae bacterium]
MKTTSARRTLAFALVMLVMLAAALPAMAATSKVYATTAVNVRSGPGTNYNIIGYLDKGEVATKLGTSGNWTKVDYNGRTGYVNTPYVKPYGSDDDPVVIDDNTAVTAYVNGSVNIRSGPGTSYAKLGEFKKGDSVVVVGATGSWSIIKWGTGTAYVSSSYLSKASPDTGSGSGTTTTMVATANVNVRTGPSTSYSILGYLVKGETVQKTGTSGNWTQVKYNNRTAYVSSTYLKAYTGGGTTPPSSSSRLYAIKETAVRVGPGTSYRAIGYLDYGDSITYLGTYNAKWYEVQLGVNIGYVYAPDMRLYGTGSDTGSTGGTVYATYTVPVYSGTSTSSTRLGYLYEGDSAARTGSVGSTWTKIKFEGQTGYVQTSRVVVTPGGTSTSGFSKLNTWMYAPKSYTYCYSIPYEQSSYRTGYLSRNEQVWAVATNGEWIQILIDDETMYVPASDLEYYSGSGSGSGYGSPGQTMYVQKLAGAPAYKDLGKNEIDWLDRGQAVTIVYRVGDYYFVTWGSKKPYKEAYVAVDRLGPSYPR